MEAVRRLAEIDCRICGKAWRGETIHQAIRLGKECEAEHQRNLPVGWTWADVRWLKRLGVSI